MYNSDKKTHQALFFESLECKYGFTVKLGATTRENLETIHAEMLTYLKEVKMANPNVAWVINTVVEVIE